MITPVNGSISIAGIVCSAANVPNAISECVRCKIVHATAAEFIPLPNMEITFAANTKRSDRFRRIDRTVFRSNLRI
jgi:hypothetical protein